MILNKSDLLDVLSLDSKSGNDDEQQEDEQMTQLLRDL